MTDLLSWWSGDLSNRARIAGALLPAILATAYFVLGLPVFAVRCLLHGVPRDRETEKRGATLIVGYFLRYYFFWLAGPYFRLLLRSGLPPLALTALSALLGAASAVAIARGHFALGGWLFLFAGMLDALDGRLARAQNDVKPAGAAVDSILDRYTDSFILIGLAWYYRETWVLLPVLACLLGSSLVPYVRARGEGLGIPIRDGLMQRVERVLILGGSVALSPILEVLVFPAAHHPMHWLAVGGVLFTAVSSNATAISRFRSLIRALGGAGAKLPRWLASRVWGASAIATAIDFAIVALARAELIDAGMEPAAATVPAMISGALVGSLVAFAIQRSVTRGMPPGRFALVSGMKMILNLGGVALLGLYPELEFATDWWIVRAAVYLAWSFPLEQYVFVPRRPGAAKMA